MRDEKKGGSKGLLHTRRKVWPFEGKKCPLTLRVFDGLRVDDTLRDEWAGFVAQEVQPLIYMSAKMKF